MTQEAATPPKPTPDRIFQIASGYMAAKYLLTGNELGIFASLAGRPASLAELAERTGVAARPLRIVADALVALRFLSKADGRYQNAAEAQAFLSGQGPADVRPILRYWNRAYVSWRDLEASIREDRAAEVGSTPTDEENRIFSAGVEALTAGDAVAVAAQYDFGGHRNLMNLGGWYVSFLLPVLRRFPELRARLVMLPQWRARAEETLASAPEASGRVELLDADYLFDDLPSGHDVVMVAHIVHHMSPDHIKSFLGHVRKYVMPGTRLLILDYFTNPEHTEPLIGVLLAGQFQLMSGEGDVYNLDEIRLSLVDTGWQFVEHRPLPGRPASLVIAEAV